MKSNNNPLEFFCPYCAEWITEDVHPQHHHYSLDTPDVRRDWRVRSQGVVFEDRGAYELHVWLMSCGARPEDSAWLQSRVRNIEVTDYSNADRYRFAPKGDEQLVDGYRQIKQSGCCGFFDTTLKGSPSGEVYLFGFNYGH